MGPYSHYILATKLEPYLQPEHPRDYYWGSVIPDIRYLAQMRRDHTHLGQESLRQISACYPHLKSFLLGYQVHCLIDQIDISDVISSTFPLNILRHVLRKNFSRQQMTMLVEMYYLRSATTTRTLDGNHNEVLNDLGILPEQTTVFLQAMQEYFRSHSFDAAISAFQKIGIIENARLEKYLNMYQWMKKRKVMNTIFMLSVKNARLDQRVMNHVRSSIHV